MFPNTQTLHAIGQTNVRVTTISNAFHFFTLQKLQTRAKRRKKKKGRGGWVINEKEETRKNTTRSCLIAILAESLFHNVHAKAAGAVGTLAT